MPEGVGGASSFTLGVKCGFLAGNSPKLGREATLQEEGRRSFCQERGENLHVDASVTDVLAKSSFQKLLNQ